MNYYGDYHIHTLFSDGSNTVRDVLRAAKERGLKEVAITDHGYYNFTLSLKPYKFRWQKKSIEKARKEFTDVSVLHGIEADIVDEKGTLDITSEQICDVDLLLAGFHRFVRSTNLKDYFRFIIYNGFFAKTFKPSAERIKKNTAAYVSAIENYPIDVITHLNHRAKVDVDEVCRTAARCGTMVEINIKHFDLVEPYIKTMLESGCTFIVNGDSHNYKHIGDFAKADGIIKKYEIPAERVANLNKKPRFTRLDEYKKRIMNGQAEL